MLKNAFAYVTRKGLKSLVILLVILTMSALSLISLSIKEATDKASTKTFSHITNSFSMEINRRVNPGTPRGGGNVKGQDIKKIANSENIESYVKRINSVADLDEYDIIETAETTANQSPARAKNFKRAVMLTGVNDSSKETKFVSGAYKLVEGKHLTAQDKNKVLIHKDLAKKNNLKVGDKIKLKSNLFDADNEKSANETVEDEIKGLFDGHNKGGVTAAQELYENTLVTDIHTAAKVYGNTEDTATYQDATFSVKGNKNLIVSLLLFLWINARKKEIAVLLSLGISKGQILAQFAVELVFVTIPAFIGSYFLASYAGKHIGNNILQSITGNIAKQIAKQSASTGLGGGAEVDGFNKTLSSLDMIINPNMLVWVIIFMTIVLTISLYVASSGILKKNPKDLLSDAE